MVSVGSGDSSSYRVSVRLILVPSQRLFSRGKGNPVQREWQQLAPGIWVRIKFSAWVFFPFLLLHSIIFELMSDPVSRRQQQKGIHFWKALCVLIKFLLPQALGPGADLHFCKIRIKTQG